MPLRAGVTLIALALCLCLQHRVVNDALFHFVDHYGHLAEYHSLEEHTYRVTQLRVRDSQRRAPAPGRDRLCPGGPTAQASLQGGGLAEGQK